MTTATANTFQSRNRETFDSNKVMGMRWQNLFRSFNLVIEKLLIPTQFLRGWHQRRGIPSFNLVIEKLLIPTQTGIYALKSASPSFNLVIEKLLIPTHRLPTFALQSLRGFNLVIEKLLIPTCWTDHIHGAQDYRFQSRNRETFDSNSERMNIASVTAKYQVSIS